MARLGDYTNIKTGKLDANASSDKSYATYEGYSAGGIEALMRAELDNNRYNIIMNNVLKGRYFMLQTAK